MSNQVLTQVQQLKNYINKEIIRQDTLVERILIALLADGLHSSCKIQKKLCFLHQRRDKAGLVSTRKFIQFFLVPTRQRGNAVTTRQRRYL